MRSMTGYGRGSAERDGWRATVELRSVNHRFLDLKIRGVSLAPTLEEAIKTRVRGACARGSVTTSIKLERRGKNATVVVDKDAAMHVRSELEALAVHLAIPERVGLELICQQPGVLQLSDEEADESVVATCVEHALDIAIDILVRMRATEGASLESDVRQRLARVSQVVETIAAESATASATLNQRLSQRVERLLESRGTELSADRLAHEIALLADRVDVTEEMVRLRSHVEHMQTLMDEASANQSTVGRRLDFLVQEMGREINTIGSKSQSSAIAHAVIEAKAEMEKIREQVQNIE